MLFTLTVMKLIGATFSLAGIAGFILSVGMAVDANILVFERFKEEMKAGKTLATAIELGFKRALTAIVDSNVCTILTSLVLMYFGTGPVKGFATTLIIGVLISLFTAVTVTRSLLMFFVGSGIADNPKLYAVDRDWFGKLMRGANDEKPLRIVETSKKWFADLPRHDGRLGPFPFSRFLGGFKPNVEFRAATRRSTASRATQTARADHRGAGEGGPQGRQRQARHLRRASGSPTSPCRRSQSSRARPTSRTSTNIATAAGLSAADNKRLHPDRPRRSRPRRRATPSTA